MDSLFEIIAQLNEDERQDFTSWFSKLSQKERKAVASAFEDANSEKVRVLLSVPKESRISLFLVEKNFWEELDDSFKPAADEAKRKADENWEELRARYPRKKKPETTWEKVKFWLNPFA